MDCTKIFFGGEAKEMLTVRLGVLKTLPGRQEPTIRGTAKKEGKQRKKEAVEQGVLRPTKSKNA